jgi:serine/threonine protein kinase
MNPVTLEHPNSEQLAAFASGQAPEETATQISLHLAECETCRTVVDALPQDTLLSLIRQPASGGLREENETAAANTSRPGVAGNVEIPPQLADHPRYRVLKLVGAGGMGAVYKAEHRRMERHVALKTINPELMKKPAMVERFQREVKTAARLTHPNIVTAHDADQAGDTHFLVMEYVEGVTLAQRVQQHGPLPIAEACDYIRQTALGLQHAFECGMVHRDIKPHNLMLTPGGQVKILDFGLARFVRETGSADSVGCVAGRPLAADSPFDAYGRPATHPTRFARATGSAEGDSVTGLAGAAPSGVPAGGLTEAGALMGTADFIAPEQADDPRHADIRADIYSLGCTLYYLLAGQVPFPEGSAVDKLAAHRERMPAPLDRLCDNVPRDLMLVIQRMLAKDPAQRFGTPAEVAEALAPFSGTASPWRRRWRRLTAAASRLNWGRLIAAASLLSAALLLGGLIYVVTDTGEFEIRTSDPKVAVMLNQKGVVIQDQAADRTYQLQVGKHKVRPGKYSIAVTELPAGVVFDTETFTLKRGGVEVASATLKSAPGESPSQQAYLVDEALSWFPADVSFVGVRDMRFLPELSIQQLLVLTHFAEKFWQGKGDRFWKLVSNAGQIERVAFAYLADAKNPGKSRIFIRLTGTLSRARVLEWFRQDWPGASVRVDPGQEGIALVSSSQPVAPAFAIVGNTDLILAGYQDVQQKHLDVVQQMLALRGGRGKNATASQALRNTHGDDFAFMIGRPPDGIKNLFLLPVLPRSLAVNLRGRNDILLNLHGLFASEADARAFADHVNQLRQQAIAFVKKPPFKINERAAGLLLTALIGIKIDIYDDAAGTGHVSAAVHVTRETVDALVGMVRDLPLAFFSKDAQKKTLVEPWIKTFGPAEKPITQDGVAPDQNGWRIEAKGKRTVRLFEVVNPGLDNCTVNFNARLRTENLQGRAYLEMLCRFPEGEFFSKGLDNTVTGTSAWASYGTPFFLKKGEKPDLLKLNLVIEGKGTVWIKDIEVRRGPLPPDAAPEADAGPPDDAAIPKLLKTFADRGEKSDTRINVASTLSRVMPGEAAGRVVPVLLKVLEDPDDDAKVRERVVWALRVHNVKLRDMPEVLHAFARVLSEPKEPARRLLRYDCAYMLAMLQGAEAPAKTLDVLLDFLKDDSIAIFAGQPEKLDARVMAVQAVAQIGAERVSRRQDIVAQLRTIAADTNTLADLRDKTKELLKNLGK